MKWNTLIVSLPLTMALAACGGESAQAPVSVNPYQCERDDSVEAGERCRVDNECACGSHCAYGTCRSACSQDSECAEGTYCDPFGRCRDQGDTEAIAGLAPNESARIDYAPQQVALPRVGAAKTVRVVSRSSQAGKVVVFASPSTEVSCDERETFAPSCTFEELEPGEEAGVSLAVRLRSGAQVTSEMAEDVVLATRNHEYVVGVTFESGEVYSNQPPAGAGIYRGQAVIRGLGLSSRDNVGEPGQLENIRVPVEVHLQAEGSGFIAEFSDERGLVFPNGAEPTLATLQPGEDDTTWTLQSPTYLYAGAESPRVEQPQIAADLEAPQVRWTGETLSFVGRVRYQGITLDASAPFVDWRITVSRVGDLEGTLSAVPAPFELSTPAAERAQIPLPAETGYSPHPFNDATFDDESSFVRAGAIVCSQRGDASLQRPGSELANDGSGDLECLPSGRMFRVPVLEAQEWNAGETMEACLAELDPTFELSGEPACVDAMRLRAAIALGLEDTRSRALGELRQPPEQGARLSTYILGQWLGVQAFVGSQFREVSRMNDVVPNSEQIEVVRSPQYLLQRLNESWDVVLHPRYGVAWGLAPQEALAQPDYRARVLDEAPAEGPQQQAAPVVIARALQGQLQVTEELIAYARFDVDQFAELQPLATEGFRQTVILMAIANGLVVDASVLGTPAWNEEWESSRDSVAQRLDQALGQLSDDINPLGIQDTDLPLYGLDGQETALSRFTAGSRFLLGESGESGVARNFVSAAQNELVAARDAYFNLKTFQYREETSEIAREKRLEDIRRDYGGQIGSLCNPNWNSPDVLGFDDATLNPERCYLRDETPSGQSCGFDEGDVRARLSVGGILTDLCVARSLRGRYGEAVSSGDAQLDQLIDNLPAERPLNAAIEDFSDNGFVRLFVDGWSLPTDQLVDLHALGELLAEGSDERLTDFLQDVRRDCSAQFGEGFGRPTQPPASCEFLSDCPVGYRCAAQQCTPQMNTPADNPQCYRGELGQMALQLRGTATDIDIANSELTEYSELYDNAMRSCLINQLGDGLIEEEIATHNTQMATLAEMKFESQIGVNVAAAAKDCAGSADALTAVTGATALVCGAAAVEAFFQSRVDNLDRQMENVERHHNLTITRLENQIDQMTCFNDAEAHLIGVRSATLRIKRARQELQQQLVEFNDMKTAVRGLIYEGRDAVKKEQSRTISPLTMDFWVDEHIQSYDRTFRTARRALYVAMLAVEYEFQMTYAGRTDILAARTVSELDVALDELTNLTLPSSISSASRPDNALAVLSLKDDLLALSDHSDFPAGQHQLNAEERLHMVLNRPENARYDDAGGFLGIEIPFSLAPRGQQQAGGVPILSGRTCAERLWTVNASIQGDDVIRGSDTQIRQIELRKRNTFYSQWCSTSNREDDYQVASVRPSRNLFLDPRAGEESSEVFSSESAGEEQVFAKASINSYINVSRPELEDETYTNGNSMGLAGRGVFGDYALFIPADAIALNGDDTGLVLSQVEDVLLRFDYVAALSN